jgi:Bifunctional DNA primase/polymerase, N-terminal
MTLPIELARLIGAAEDSEARPIGKLDWALRWAKQGLHVFPCEHFTGIPLVSNWYRAAATQKATIAEWWSENPTADPAAVPDKSGHYVILAIREDGLSAEPDSVARNRPI